MLLLLDEEPSIDVSVFLMLEVLFTGDPALGRLAVVVDGLGIVSLYTCWRLTGFPILGKE